MTGRASHGREGATPSPSPTVALVLFLLGVVAVAAMWFGIVLYLLPRIGPLVRLIVEFSQLTP